MSVDSWPVGLVIRPKTVINIAVNVDELSLTMGSIFTPLARIFGAIRPNLLPVAISESAFPLASKNCASFELVRWSILSRLVSFVNTFAYRFPCLLLREVLTRAKLLRTE